MNKKLNMHKILLVVILLFSGAFNDVILPYVNLKKIDSLLTKLNTANPRENLKTYIELLGINNRVQPAKSIEYGNKALGLARKLNDLKAEGDIYYLIGLSFHSQSDYNTALKYYDSSYAIRKKINDNVGIGEYLNRYAMICEVRGEYEKATEICLQAINILEKENDPKALARAYNSLGIIYYITGDIEKAKEQSYKALSFSELVKDDMIHATSHEHLGIIYIKLKDYDKALYHVESTIELRKKANDRIGLGGAYGNLGLIYRDLKRFDESLKYFNESLIIRKELNSKRSIAASLAGIGITYYEMGEYEKSLSHLLQAYEIRKASNDKRGIVASSNRLANTYFKMNDFKNAYQYLKIAKNENDSLMNEQKLKTIAELQEKYEREKRDQKILLLQKENTIQTYFRNSLLIITLMLTVIVAFVVRAYRSKRKTNDILIENNSKITMQKEALQLLNEQLKETNAAKDKFFSIIAHDLKSPYQGLLGYSQLLSTEYATLTEAEKISFIGNIEQLSNSTYKLLENLLEWARLQTGKMNFIPEKFDLLLELYPTFSLLKQTSQNKKIEFTYSIDKNVSVFADVNMVSSIVRNLVANSIKFTNQGGKVTLNSSIKGDYVEIAVKDTGVGIKPEKLETLFKIDKSTSTDGTANEKGTGLGLLLCKEMIERHGGKIWVESQVNVGSTFFFTLPLSDM